LRPAEAPAAGAPPAHGTNRRRLGDVAAIAAMLDLLFHHAHLRKCGPKSWRTAQALHPEATAG
jgi:hypothetical protein